jgi:hypothetical protein
MMSLRRTRAWISTYAETFVFSLDSAIAQGLFTSCALALIFHKATVIFLYAPPTTLEIILYGPFLFTFDFLTLVLLHRGLASRYRGWQIFAGLFCTVIILCSAGFMSFYLEANTEINWGRSVEVLLVN